MGEEVLDLGLRIWEALGWSRLSLWRLSIPQPAICVRRPPHMKANCEFELHDAT